MITISVLGLDQYVVGHYSKEHTANLANLFEINEDEVNFYAPESMIFHSGVEQTSWNSIVIVKAPSRCEAVEAKVADYLIKTLSEFTINLEVEFEYFEEGHRYAHVNSSYPRFIKEDNLVDVEAESGDDSDEDDEEPNPADHAELDPNDPNQIFLGNAFEGHEHELDEKAAEDEAKKTSSPKKKA
jgi:hypothetical protein